uniref:Uncharacterized protein n=1 Tax=Anguilla anguilla TaxID=7936 RepID=A0A0E9WWF9_ANGAN
MNLTDELTLETVSVFLTTTGATEGLMEVQANHSLTDDKQKTYCGGDVTSCQLKGPNQSATAVSHVFSLHA